METIGKKIKRLRKAKGYSQDSTYTLLNNKGNSQVSQIENEKIPNPTQPVLQNIASNLDISFEELIKGTSWRPNPMLEKVSQGYAYSSKEFSVDIDNGLIKCIPDKYSKLDDDGNENKFCPKSGTKLVSKCTYCKKSINNSTSKFCSGCGKELDILGLSLHGNFIQDRINEIESILRHHAGWKINHKINENSREHLLRLILPDYRYIGQNIEQKRETIDYNILQNKIINKIVAIVAQSYESMEKVPFDEREYHIEQIKALENEKIQEKDSMSYPDRPNNSDWIPECRTVVELEKLMAKHWKALGVIDIDNSKDSAKDKKYKPKAIELSVDMVRNLTKSEKKSKK